MSFAILRMTASICLAIVLAKHYVRAETPTGELASATRQAKSQFRALTEPDLQEARQQVLAAADRLEQRFKEGGPNAAEWREFVEFDAMRAQFAAGHTPDLAKVNEIWSRYAGGYSGLGLAAFRDVRQALQTYWEVAHGSSDKTLQSRYDKILDGLAGQLEAYAKLPTPAIAHQIDTSLAWLANHRQAPDLRQRIAAAFHQPNMVIRISGALAGAGVDRTVDQTEPVEDCILGTTIHGTGHVTGQVTTQLASDDERAVFDVVLLATVNSNNVGYNGPVQVNNSGCTSIGAIKRVWATADGLWALPASSNAQTSTTITGICANRPIVERIAWKRAGQQKCEAEAIASQHAEQRMNARMDQQITEQITQANDQYYETIRGPLVERGLFPETLQFRSTGQQLSLALVETNPWQVAVAGAPPLEPDPQADLAVVVHETMINNFAQNAFGGMTVHEEEVRAFAIHVLGHLPPELKPDEEREPWGIAFAEHQPITVSFGDGAIDITVRGRRYFQGDSPRPGMQITAHYKLVTTGQGVKAVRQGGFEIVPPDGNRQLSGPETAAKRALQRRFDKILPKEIIPQSFVPPGNWAKAGTLMPIQIACRDGWAVLAWKLAASSPAARPATSVKP